MRDVDNVTWKISVLAPQKYQLPNISSQSWLSPHRTTEGGTERETRKRDALTGCHRTMCQLHGCSPLMLITGDRAKYKALHMITMTLEEVLHGLLYSQADSCHYACWDFVGIFWWSWPLKEREEKRTYLQYRMSCADTVACQLIRALKKKAS